MDKVKRMDKFGREIYSWEEWIMLGRMDKFGKERQLGVKKV